MNRISYLIAEDEPALAKELSSLIKQFWPECVCAGIAQNGDEALEIARRTQPTVVYLDVRMPGRDGLSVAKELCREPNIPLMVFVTAFDQYALAAFDTAALDYVLKPVEPDRLALCISRLKSRLQLDQKPVSSSLLAQLQQISPGRPQKPYLRYIRAGNENSVRIIPVEEVLYFEARDKYVSVVTSRGESLIRMSLRDLLLELDPDHFWQVHRSLIVNAQAVVSADRDTMGRVRLNMRNDADRLVVSRQFAHLFKPM